jgi:hypothetical protein
MQGVQQTLISRHYPTFSRNPQRILINVVFPIDQPPYACVEFTLISHKMQSYVHDILYECIVGEDIRFYRVFFRRHRRLPINKSVRHLTRLHLQGDVTIMRTDADGEVRNDMIRTDIFRANHIVAEYISSVFATNT